MSQSQPWESVLDVGRLGHEVTSQADGWRVKGLSKHLSNACNVSGIVLGAFAHPILTTLLKVK